jgi:hypothetical protein
MPSTLFRAESLEERRLMSFSLPPIHIPGTDTTLFVPTQLGGPSSGPITRVGPVNGDFSTSPDFTGWQTSGNEMVTAADFHSIPDGKKTQAVISNAQIPNGGKLPVTAAALETFLGLGAGALSSTGNPAVNGSAIQQNVTGKRGDVITFKADFLTNEAIKTNRDYAFVTITLNGKTQLFKLTGALKATVITDGSGFASETGYHTYAVLLPKSGQYTIGYGVVNVGDSAFASDLLVDNVQLKPNFFDFDRGFGGFDNGDHHDHDSSDSSSDHNPLFD